MRNCVNCAAIRASRRRGETVDQQVEECSHVDSRRYLRSFERHQRRIKHHSHRQRIMQTRRLRWLAVLPQLDQLQENLRGGIRRSFRLGQVAALQFALQRDVQTYCNNQNSRSRWMLYSE